MFARPAPHPDVTVEEVDDQICLYRRSDETVLVLNQAASDIWRLADGELTPNEIVAALARVYNAESDRLRRDVMMTLDDLCARGFLTEGADEPTG